MAVSEAPSLLKATAVFNPAASALGFLVPLFPGFDGDNQAYVQRFHRPDRLLGFTEVSWPDEGATRIPTTLAVAVGDESLWGFAFPDEEPLVLPWRLFRSEMRRRIDDPCFEGKPGLLFDVVDGLDIEEAKERVYLAAFEAYEQHGSGVAERWRDRSILEPLLQGAIAPHPPVGSVDKPRGLAARLSDGELLIELRHESADLVRDKLMRAYERLAERHPKLFPRRVALSITDGLAKATGGVSSRRTTVVAIHGRLAERELARDRWLARGIEVVDARALTDFPRRKGEQRQVVIVSALADWADPSPRAIDADHAVAVLMTTAMAPLVSEADMRTGSSIPTVVTFSPYGTSRIAGDPLSMVSRLITTMVECWKEGEALLPAEHNSVVRESRPMSADVAATACGLLGRALRVEAPVDTPARLVLDRGIPPRMQVDLSEALASALPMLETRVVDARAVAGRSIPMLITERPTTGDGRENLREGVKRLLRLRGWHAENHNGGMLKAWDETHNFSVLIARHNNEIRKLHHPSDRPSFGRSSLLVVHESPRREWLLAGNLGQYFHVSLEDIALMVPGTQWVWPILRRQLRGQANRPSLTTLKLFAALAAEALVAGRYQNSIVKFDPDKAVRLLVGPDCVEHVRISSEDAPDDGAQLILSGMRSEIEPYLRIHIADEGPFVEIV